MDNRINLVIVGFQKCATTSIKNYLAEHPSILSHQQKEMTYFADEEERNEGIIKAFKRYYPNFNSEANYKYILAKHATLIRHEESVKKLYQHNPDAKIIVCLRNPVARAFSSYLMELANGEDMLAFEKVIEDAFKTEKETKPNWHYNVFIRLGQYADYIEILLNYFDKQNIHFCNIEEFKLDSHQGMHSMLKWLGLSNSLQANFEKKHNEIKGIKYKWLSSITKNLLTERSLVKNIGNYIIPASKRHLVGEFLRKLNKRSIKPPVLSDEASTILKNHYRPFNDRLKALTGIDLNECM